MTTIKSSQDFLNFLQNNPNIMGGDYVASPQPIDLGKMYQTFALSPDPIQDRKIVSVPIFDKKNLEHFPIKLTDNVAGQVDVLTTSMISYSRSVSPAAPRVPVETSNNAIAKYTMQPVKADLFIPDRVIQGYGADGVEVLDILLRQFAELNEADQLRIAFNGTSVAATSNPVANPLGQDLNIGWIKYVEQYAQSRVYSATKVFQIGIGPNADAAVVQVLLNNIWQNPDIFPPHLRDQDIECYVSDDLLRAGLDLMNNTDPQKLLAAHQFLVGDYAPLKINAGLKFFPSKTIIFAKKGSLKRYMQRGQNTLNIVKTPNADGICLYGNRTECFVAEDLAHTFVVPSSKIKLWQNNAWV